MPPQAFFARLIYPGFFRYGFGFRRTAATGMDKQIAFRKKVYTTLDELQADLDDWMKTYNENRTHSGKYCYGKTPMQTFLDSIPLVREKMLNQAEMVSG